MRVPPFHNIRRQLFYVYRHTRIAGYNPDVEKDVLYLIYCAIRLGAPSRRLL